MNADDSPETSATEEEASAGAPPPRLGVIHLLAWLTVAAVFLGTERSVLLLETAASRPDTRVEPYFLLDSIRVIALAAGVVGLAALVRWRTSERPQPLGPGHWILAVDGTAMLLVYGVVLARRTIVAVLVPADSRITYLPELVLIVAILVARMFAFAVAAQRQEVKGGWRRIMVMLAIAAAAQATFDAILFLILGGWFVPPFTLFDFFYPASGFVAGAVACATIIYASYDAFRVRRDWLHSLGVAMVFVNGLIWVGYWIVTRWSS
jgi:hypothetical protein